MIADSRIHKQCILDIHLDAALLILLIIEVRVGCQLIQKKVSCITVIVGILHAACLDLRNLLIVISNCLANRIDPVDLVTDLLIQTDLICIELGVNVLCRLQERLCR